MTAPPPAAGFPGQAQAVAQRSALIARLHYHPEIGSTNDEGMALARAGAPHGTLVLADRQAAGRGRHGRRWESPAGVGLWLSLVLRPDLALDRTFGVTAAAAIAVADTIERMTGRAAGIRWPNDVLVAGRKAAGLLAEVGNRGDRCDFLVLGIGLNVNQSATDFPEALRAEATSLRLLAGTPLDRAAALGVFLEAFELQYARLGREDGAPVRAEWLRRAPLIGRNVRVDMGTPGTNGSAASAGPGGAPDIFTARAVGLAPDGALVVELVDGRRREVRAADVRLMREEQAG